MNNSIQRQSCCHKSIPPSGLHFKVQMIETQKVCITVHINTKHKYIYTHICTHALIPTHCNFFNDIMQ